MADTIPRTMSAATISKWYLLAEERSRHFAELHRTGRWRQYYTQEQLAAHMEAAKQSAQMWLRMIESPGVADPPLEPAAEEPTPSPKISPD